MSKKAVILALFAWNWVLGTLNWLKGHTISSLKILTLPKWPRPRTVQNLKLSIPMPGSDLIMAWAAFDLECLGNGTGAGPTLSDWFCWPTTWGGRLAFSSSGGKVTKGWFVPGMATNTMSGGGGAGRPGLPNFQNNEKSAHNEGLRQLFFTVLWDLCAQLGTPDSVLDSL